MTAHPPPARAPVVIAAGELDALIGWLRDDGYRVMGPAARDGAIVFDELRGGSDLPIGWGDEQAPGRYRLRRRDDDARFGWAVGPQGARRELSPPTVTLVTIRRGTDDAGRGTFDAVVADHEREAPVALFGLRPCEVAAMAVHDRVMLDGAYPDPVQAARGAGRAVVSVDCASPASTCFCSTMGTGPSLPPDRREVVDLRVAELDPGGDHRFVLWSHSTLGDRALGAVASRPAEPIDLDAAARAERAACDAIVRHVDGASARRIHLVPEDPRWEDVARRCLSCANCTMVCPTCFCSTTVDEVDLGGDVVTRSRTWDSCFTIDHSYLHGGAVRASTRSRYRQWLTHKFAFWWEQFDESGCVGCGRCITWCPAEIDVTEELDVLGRQL